MIHAKSLQAIKDQLDALALESDNQTIAASKQVGVDKQMFEQNLRLRIDTLVELKVVPSTLATALFEQDDHAFAYTLTKFQGRRVHHTAVDGEGI